MSKIKTIKAIAPGKIILSGEHAVVYHNPALAMAVNLFAATTLSALGNSRIIFELDNLNYQHTFTKDELLELEKNIEARYQQFLSEKIPISAVLIAPENLAIYTFIAFLKKNES